jgi:hypothetical protein
MKQLLYRYLASKVGTEEASEKVSVLMSYVEMLHRCGSEMFEDLLFMDFDLGVEISCSIGCCGWGMIKKKI